MDRQARPILITGGTGFIACCLAMQLMEAGDDFKADIDACPNRIKSIELY